MTERNVYCGSLCGYPTVPSQRVILKAKLLAGRRIEFIDLSTQGRFSSLLIRNTKDKLVPLFTPWLPLSLCRRGAASCGSRC